MNYGKQNEESIVAHPCVQHGDEHELDDATFTFDVVGVNKDGVTVYDKDHTLTVAYDEETGVTSGSVVVDKLPDGTYTVTEQDPGTYTTAGGAKYTVKVSYTGNGIELDDGDETSVAVENTYTYQPELVSVNVAKDWKDEDNRDGARPAKITVDLYADGVKVEGKSVELTAPSWTHTWKELAKYENGVEIVYTVDEVLAAGSEYTKVVGDDTDDTDDFAYTITNSYTPKRINIQGIKVWDDANNQDGIRPNTIVVELYANDKDTGKSMSTDASKNYAFAFENLYKYEAGQVIKYSVKDVADGYKSSFELTESTAEGAVAGDMVGTLTNEHEPYTVSVKVTKDWDDANNQDGKRHAEVTVKLYADGDVKDTQVLSETNNWTYTWPELPMNRAKTGEQINAAVEKIVYTVEEVLPENSVYSKSVSVDTDNTDNFAYTITNSYTPAKITISGEKTWVDENNYAGKRPQSIIVNLLANGTEVDQTVVTPDNDGKWTYTFANKPEYSRGQKITYTVTEDPVEHYASSYNGYNITNTFTPGKTSFTVTKVWEDANDQDGVRPESIKVQLKADGVNYGAPVTLSGSSWSYTWNNLHIYKSGSDEIDANRIVYTVEELGYTVVVPNPEYNAETNANVSETIEELCKVETLGYTSVVEGYTITNTRAPEKTNVSVTKVWGNGTRGKEQAVTMNLLADGSVIDSVELNGTWNHTWNDLPKYSAGKLISYTVTEDALEGSAWSQKVENNGNNWTVTNSYYVAPPTTSLTVNKVWVGDDGLDIRPDSITVERLKNGTPDGTTAVLSAANGWSVTWYGLSIGSTWSAREVSVPEGYGVSYSTSGNTVTVTNTYTPELPDNPPPLEDLPEDDIPLADVPATGDASLLWLAMTAISGAGLFLNRKKREDEE